MPRGAPPPGLDLLWSGRVSELAAEAAAAAHTLDTSERQRLTSLRRAADRERYLVAHVTLRSLLGERLGIPPASVVIARQPCAGCAGPHGRPVVPGDPVHFSLSHAGDRVLIALARTAVGVDVEEVPAASAAEEVLSLLHPREHAELEAVLSGERAVAFARCWVRKEAYLKATGAGLTEHPSVTYLGSGVQPAHPPGWHVTDVRVDPGYAAAVTTGTGAALPPHQVPVPAVGAA